MRYFWAAIFFCLVTSSLLYAHEHKKAGNADSVVATAEAVKDSLQYPGAAVAKTAEKIQDYKVIISRELFEHLHNKIVHFPIAFVMGAFLFTLLNFRRQVFDPAIRILVIIAALASLVAFFTGNNQAAAFEASAKEWLVEVHEDFGIATIITVWLWTATLFFKPLKRYAPLAGFIAAALVLITGFYGGIIAH